jgi:hypothetical protein
MRVFRLIDRPTLIAQFQFEPRDIWIGVFWRHTEIALHLYICVLPLLPLHITICTFKGSN